MLRSTIEVEATEVFATSENASNVTGGPFTVIQVNEAVVFHLDNAEAQIIHGNTTGAILELIETVRSAHGTEDRGVP